MKWMKLAACTGVLGAMATGAEALTQEPPAVLTKAIRKQLDAQLPGWTVAAAPACAAGANPVTSDIDFDRSIDVAMVVDTPGGEPHIVVAMPRVVDGARAFDLGPLSAIAGATHVVVLPQGRPVRWPGAMLDDYLSGPTFAAASCAGPVVAFVWTGYGFRTVPVS
jgi:hypothetical protein